MKVVSACRVFIEQGLVVSVDFCMIVASKLYTIQHSVDYRCCNRNNFCIKALFLGNNFEQLISTVAGLHRIY